MLRWPGSAIHRLPPPGGSYSDTRPGGAHTSTTASSSERHALSSIRESATRWSRTIGERRTLHAACVTQKQDVRETQRTPATTLSTKLMPTMIHSANVNSSGAAKKAIQPSHHRLPLRQTRGAIATTLQTHQTHDEDAAQNGKTTYMMATTTPTTAVVNSTPCCIDRKAAIYGGRKLIGLQQSVMS